MDETKKEAIELMARGMHQAEVARQVGVTPQRLNYWVKSKNFQKELEAKKNDLHSIKKKEIPDNKNENTLLSTMDNLRNKEILLLDNLQEGMLDIALDGSSRAAEVILKISERRAKLLGLDRKSINVLEAVNVLLKENILSEKQANIINNGVNRVWEDLRNVENLN